LEGFADAGDDDPVFLSGLLRIGFLLNLGVISRRVLRLRERLALVRSLRSILRDGGLRRENKRAERDGAANEC